MSNQVKHHGTVIGTDGQTVRVQILQAAACSSCHISHNCSVADMKKKIVEIHVPMQSYQAGDEVMISMSTKTAWHALTIAFCLPLCVLLGVLTGTKLLGVADITAALLSIAFLIPYYITLWFRRNSITNKMQFKVEAPNIA